MPTKSRSSVAEAMAELPGGKGPLVELGYAKTVLDGVLSTRTAYLLEDYADRTGWQGEPFQSVEDLTGKIVEANEAGFPIAVHAIGDGAVQMTLDAFAAADTAPLSAEPDRAYRSGRSHGCEPLRQARRGRLDAAEPCHRHDRQVYHRTPGRASRAERLCLERPVGGRRAARLRFGLAHLAAEPARAAQRRDLPRKPVRAGGTVRGIPNRR